MYFIVTQLRKDRGYDPSSQLHIHYQQHICSLFNASSHASSSCSSHCSQQADLAAGQGGMQHIPIPELGPLTLTATARWKYLQGSTVEEGQGLISEQQRARGLSWCAGSRSWGTALALGSAVCPWPRYSAQNTDVFRRAISGLPIHHGSRTKDDVP